MGVPEGENREKGTESFFTQIISENSPNLWKELDPQIQEDNRTPSYLSEKKKSFLKHTVLK